jgi:hypothetical protein
LLDEAPTTEDEAEEEAAAAADEGHAAEFAEPSVAAFLMEWSAFDPAGVAVEGGAETEPEEEERALGLTEPAELPEGTEPEAGVVEGELTVPVGDTPPAAAVADVVELPARGELPMEGPLSQNSRNSKLRRLALRRSSSDIATGSLAAATEEALAPPAPAGGKFD